MDPIIGKYLARYAHSVSREHWPDARRAFTSALVVPAYRESPHCLEGLLGPFDGRPEAAENLLILVVNQPRGAPPSALEENRTLLEAVRRRAPATCGGSGPLSFHLADNEVSILLVDLTSEPWHTSPKEGVGAARKAGMDLALRLFDEGRLAVPLVGSSDADVRLPPSYFEVLRNCVASARANATQRPSAVLFPYRHVDADESMKLVELTFRHYVLGLARAGSPYAYHSLGSALAVSLPHYARARGFPRRAAGEDFYLLEKLSRLGPLRRLVAPHVLIHTRASDRVPFGTGPALIRARCEGSPVMSYHPESFALLKLTLDVLSSRLNTEQKDWNDVEFIRKAGAPPWLEDHMKMLWQRLAPTLAECPSAAHRARRLHEVLDALRTLQLIHLAHDRELPMLPVIDALTRGRFADRGSTDDVLGQLQTAEEALPEWIGPPVR